jgi:hypothetical protein
MVYTSSLKRLSLGFFNISCITLMINYHTGDLRCEIIIYNQGQFAKYQHPNIMTSMSRGRFLLVRTVEGTG